MDDIAKTMAAFATHKGGVIYVGVNNRFEPVGARCPKEIQAQIYSTANNIRPPVDISVEVIPHDTKTDLFVTCIHVAKGNVIHSFKNVPYQRRGDTNHALTPDETFEIQKQHQKLYFDEMPAISAERPALITDIDEIKVRNFLQNYKAIQNGRFDIKRFLINNNLLVEGTVQVKNAGIMVFGKTPSKFIPQNKISLCIFPSPVITDNFVKKDITGDITELYSRALTEIQRNVNVFSFVDGSKRIDVPEYPPEILREALINAIVHRDYFDRNTEIFVKIFSDRIEFLNPASFPFENTSFEEIKKSGLSKRRNPIIARIMEQFKFMEQEGRGLKRIELLAEQHGLPKPLFEAGDRTLKVVIYNSSKTPEKIKASPIHRKIDFSALNERQIKLITQLRQHNTTINRKEYMTLVNTNEKTASRDLNDLVKRNILNPTGRARGRRYYLT